MTSLKERFIGKTGVEIVANDNNNSCGSIIIGKKKVNGHIGYLSVKPEYRRNGLGKKLLQGAENWARREGLGEIGGKLTPVPGSEKPIINLLKSKGYQIDKNGNVRKKL